ncbi:cellulose biosynthesis cyclic di-GMP-binding regulatory protein BcsB [Andreprevotia chitinilytica]|uniref:cellulose biosynthesis cyclic di-GMP-binding regulatory protein BcsB n=1 Tax=Andreprevotia chitinilytica TaxID=396808 RepID=UPI000558AA66|nr:cellulose biosynthesis cyclic di-GMP-binding regulatory protein BcsB [Andreprevotia chitinilytica]
MTPSFRTTPSATALRRDISVLGLIAYLTLTGSAWAASGAAQQFQQWADDHWVSRQVSLAELGFVRPTVLTGSDKQSEIYLPVPAGVPLADATLQFNAKYLRADGGRTSMTLAVDGYPVAARSLTEAQGDASQSVGIDGLPRAGGFVRFGITWSSIVSELMCTDQRAPGNSLQVAPDSRFSYRYDRNAIKTLTTAWSALPPAPVLLVAAGALAPASYDTAWRVGVTLERAGKRVQLRALPAVGDTVNLSKLNVPASLRSIPAFAALASGEAQHHIKNDAERGALIALGNQGPLRADLVVNDQALQDGLRKSLDALNTEIKASAPDAAAAYTAWQASASPLLGQLPGKDQVQLSALAGNPVIAVAGDAGAKVAGLFGNLWRPVAQGKALTINAATAPEKGDATVLLSQFGGTAGTLDVIARADRSATFDIGALGADGSLPTEIVFDVSAAPNTGGEAPVASIFLNDFLLGAEHLRADGRPQRISAVIPRYALAARNEIRIAFLRQPTQLRCHDQPTAFPVSLLPSSHLRLKKIAAGNDFVGMAGRYAGDSSVLVPAGWLNSSATSLPLVIRLADAAGVSPERAALQLAKAGEEAKPEHAFLAFDTALADVKPAVTARNGSLVLTAEAKEPVLSLNGLDRVATVEVVTAAGETGILYRTVGQAAPTLDQPFRLTHGNVAVLGDGGPVSQLDTNDPTGSKLAKEGNPQSLWESHMTLWLVIMGVVAFVLIAARVAQVRRRKAGGEGH